MKISLAVGAYVVSWIMSRILDRVFGNNPNAIENCIFNGGLSLLVGLSVLLI